jgi:hypothetical protein
MAHGLENNCYFFNFQNVKKSSQTRLGLSPSRRIKNSSLVHGEILHFFCLKAEEGASVHAAAKKAQP